MSVPGASSAAGADAMMQARARFAAFGTAAPQSAAAAPVAQPSVPAQQAATAAGASQAATQAQLEARIRAEIGSMPINVPKGASTVEVLRALGRSIQSPTLSREAAQRVYEFQARLFESHKEAMNIALSMIR